MAGALSLSLLGLQLLGLAHLALERHGVCWEHGTVTELGTAQLALSVPAPVDAVAGLHDGQSPAGVGDADADHHCPVQASRRDWGAPSAGAPLLLAVAKEVGDVAPGTSMPRGDDGLLGRAPKQSPPRAA